MPQFAVDSSAAVLLASEGEIKGGGILVKNVSGQLQQVNGADPAAGAEVTDAVPTGRYWDLLAVTVVLVQGLTQTPQPVLQIDDGADVIFESFGATGAQAVSTTARYTWASGLVLSALVGATPNIHGVAPLPAGLRLGPGYRIRTSTPGIGANSNYGAPGYLVIERGANDVYLGPDNSVNDTNGVALAPEDGPLWLPADYGDALYGRCAAGETAAVQVQTPG